MEDTARTENLFINYEITTLNGILLFHVQYKNFEKAA
jgi:hypothetical protein